MNVGATLFIGKIPQCHHGDIVGKSASFYEVTKTT